ncbi:hypothetical protein NIES2100_71130 [Calothrix sp. NIES-2100]|uniref:hypothetical protein n=1 Tax=Calothrix sp. NIES-2100 TaxID=1954172 RepID=UPI000B61DC89|nr:hypothetical protein NIES2100_71130 [Calothrix sp. NIES-2100]
MIKLAVRSLINLFITSSALFLIPMKSDASINIKIMTQVAQSCQRDVFSSQYRNQMGLGTITVDDRNDRDLKDCIRYRYHYSLVFSRFPWLISTGEMLPGYPGAVVIGMLANKIASSTRDNTNILDCLANQDVYNRGCDYLRNNIAEGGFVRTLQIDPLYPIFIYPINKDNSLYLIHTCPSCVVAHNNVRGSQIEILQSFIQWFITLDKQQRKELISILGDDNNARELRQTIYNETETAVNKYESVRQQIEHQEQEQRRQELIGN